MQTVIQQDRTGCGIACVAMLAGKSYEEVKQKAESLGIFTEDERLWSQTKYVRDLLREYRIHAAETETLFSSWAALPDLALLSIKHRVENGKPLWHWTVFRRNSTAAAVHDPAAYLEENDRIDFNNIHPKWFIKISSQPTPNLR